MRGVRLTGGRPTAVELVDRSLPAPAGRLVVRVTHVLVDEADRRDRSTERWLGAGGVGEVTATGDGVDPGLVGLRVLVAGPAPCRACGTCRRGQPHLCLAPTGESATRGVGAARAELVVSADRTLAVPTGLDPSDATVVGGVALAGAAAVRGAARVVPGERVAIVGDAAALVATAVARAAGARSIVACPLEPGDADLARRFGATAVGEPADLVDLAREATDGTGVDAAVLLGASSARVGDALAATRPGGTVVLVDVTPEDADDDATTRGVAVRVGDGRTVVDAPYGAADALRDLPWIVALALDGSLPLGDLFEPGEPGLDGVLAAVGADDGPRRSVHTLG